MDINVEISPAANAVWWPPRCLCVWYKIVPVIAPVPLVFQIPRFILSTKPMGKLDRDLDTVLRRSCLRLI